MFDRGAVPDLKNESVHIIAGLFKLWLRKLPDPIIPFSHYHEWIKQVPILKNLEIGKEVKKTAEITKILTHLLDQLPKENKQVLTEIMRFVVRVVSYHQVNLMTSANMSIVLSPNILYIPIESNEDLLNTSFDISGSNEAIRILIEYSKHVFKFVSKDPKFKTVRYFILFFFLII